jgi:hypothetical protein
MLTTKDNHITLISADADCKRCGGLGVYPVQDGPEDFEEVECGCARHV